ncbi:MAG: hypothetical protein U0Q07_13460 [Acidimicrobiales bacterium]
MTTASAAALPGAPSGPAPRGAADAVARWWTTAAAIAARADRGRRARRLHVDAAALAGVADPEPGAVASGAAALKLALIGLGGLVGGPVVGRVALRNNEAVTDLAWQYPGLVADLLADRSIEGGDEARRARPLFARVQRASAAGRYVITSDLHRGPAGTNDWPGLQDTTSLYGALLDWYGDGGWGLVEDGDVEDFWMVGGSTYGVVYEVGRWLGHAWRGRSGRRLLRAVYAEHLRRVVDHNAAIYERIQDRFHAHGRYHRIVGNHDDAYLDEDVAARLAEVHPGLDVLDALVLDGPDGGVGLVTHGHHTDAWNAPGRAGLGKLGTWLGSTVGDAPFTGGNPGRPTADATRRLLSGEQPSTLTEVSTLFGANRHLYSMDEVVLHDAWTAHFGDAGPWLVLGHTHLPLDRPADPRGRRSWDRYVNAGCGVFHGMLTAVEWDGAAGPGDGSAPAVSLVAWHWADGSTPDAAVVAEVDGRPVARRVLRRGPDGHLVVEPAVPAVPADPPVSSVSSDAPEEGSDGR